MKFTNKNIFELSDFTTNLSEFINLRKGNMPPIVIDIRSPEEFEQEHLSGANNLPGEFLKDNLMQLPPFAKIVIYGDSDDTKTAESIKLLNDQGFSDFSYIPGGLQTILQVIRDTEGEVFLSDLPKDEWSAMIEKVLDEKIRPALASDGGGMEVLKIDGSTVYISYQGACSGCASSTTGTLRFIQTTLSVALNHDIKVVSS
jgi:Fe-S cluster biogenesis protein NfuA/rhodanese-related sulfurtransferase